MTNLSYDAKIKYFSVSLTSNNWVDDTSSTGTYRYDWMVASLPITLADSKYKYDIVGSTELYTAMVDNSIKGIYVDFNTNLRYIRTIGGKIASDITITMIAYYATEEALS